MLRYQKRGACSSKYQKCICRLLCACFWFKYMVSLPVYREVVVFFSLCFMWNRYSCTYSSSVSSICEHCNQREMDKMKPKQNSMNPFVYVCALEYFSMCTIIHGLNVWNYLSSLVRIIHYWQNAKCTVSIFLETLSWIFASLSASRPLITSNCLLNCRRLMDQSIEVQTNKHQNTHTYGEEI